MNIFGGLPSQRAERPGAALVDVELQVECSAKLAVDTLLTETACDVPSCVARDNFNEEVNDKPLA